MLTQARQGDRSVLPQLRAWLDSNPDYWRRAGDLGQVAESAWIALVASGDSVNEECVRRKLADMRRELAGSDPSPLEKILVDRVVLCWLQASYADGSYVNIRGKGCTDLRVFKAAEERQNRSQRRLLAAIKALATTRRLLRPRTTVIAEPIPTLDQPRMICGSRKGRRRRRGKRHRSVA
jgi:hypothetical protein